MRKGGKKESETKVEKTKVTVSDRKSETECLKRVATKCGKLQATGKHSEQGWQFGVRGYVEVR